MNWFVRCLPAVVALGLAAPPVAAQDVSAQRFEGQSDVVEVQVPVTVVDRSGVPVRGLGVDDFELYDRGRLQRITNLSVHDLEAVPAAAAPATIPSAARRHFLLLFDLSFSRPSQILRARQAARDLVLHRLHPQDLVGVVVYSLEHGPRLVMTFTPDRAQLARAIDTLGMDRTPGKSATLDPLRFMLAPTTLDPAAAGGGSPSSSGGARVEVGQMATEHMQALVNVVDKDQKQFERSRITAFTRALGDMARQLDAVRGRKQVVLFSEGFDSKLLVGRAIEEGAEREQEAAAAQSGRIWTVDFDDRFGNIGLQNDVARMIEEFRRADCVIQAVDIGGLRAGGEISRPSRSLGQEALFVLANETGGQLFKESNDLGAELDRVLRSTRLTYVLTFTPDLIKPDGSYHRVRVELKRGRGGQVAHRAGYYAPRPFRELDPLEKGLLASDAIASAVPHSELKVNVLAAPFRGGEHAAYVPVIIEVAGRELLAGREDSQLRVEIYGYVTDQTGEMRDFFNQTVGIDIGKSRAALERTGVKYYGHFELAPGEHLLRILVRDADSGRSGVTMLPLSVPPYADRQPFLLPPFFLEAPGKWVLVRESGANQERTVVYPFTVNGDPYVPSARPQLANAEAARLVLVAYNFGKGEFDLDGQVINDAGQVVAPALLSGVERTTTGIAGLDKVLASFAPAGLEAGNYRLQVALRDRASGNQEISSIPFVVN